MTFDIAPVLLAVGMVIGVGAAICRCAALAHLLPGATKWEFEILYRFPKRENYTDKGKWILTLGGWLAVTSGVLVGVSVYLRPDILN